MALWFISSVLIQISKNYLEFRWAEFHTNYRAAMDGENKEQKKLREKKILKMSWEKPVMYSLF